MLLVLRGPGGVAESHGRKPLLLSKLVHNTDVREAVYIYLNKTLAVSSEMRCPIQTKLKKRSVANVILYTRLLYYIH